MKSRLEPEVRSALESFFSLHHNTPFQSSVGEFEDDKLIEEILRILGGIDLDPATAWQDVLDICEACQVGIDVAVKFYTLILDELSARVRAKLAELVSLPLSLQQQAPTPPWSRKRSQYDVASLLEQKDP